MLAGHGVRLERVAEHHLPGLLRIARDADIWRYMMARVVTEADVEVWLRSAIRDDENERNLVWITCFDSGEVIGSTRLFDLDLTHRTAELGHTWLAAQWRGKGINPRTKYLQLTHAFEHLHLRRVALKTHHENLQSQHAMLKLGARYEGTFRNHMIMPDGSTRHSKWYSIVADEWPAVRDGLLKRIAAEPLS